MMQKEPLRMRYILLMGLLGLGCVGGNLLGCSKSKELPVVPVGTPTNPPPPRLEGHRAQNAKTQ